MEVTVLRSGGRVLSPSELPNIDAVVVAYWLRVSYRGIQISFQSARGSGTDIPLKREKEWNIFCHTRGIKMELWNYLIQIYLSKDLIWVIFQIWVVVACVGNFFSVDTQFATWHIFATLANKIFLNTNIFLKFFHCQISFVQEMYHPTMQQYHFMLVKLIWSNFLNSLFFMFSFLNGAFGPEDLTR